MKKRMIKICFTGLVTAALIMGCGNSGSDDNTAKNDDSKNGEVSIYDGYYFNNETGLDSFVHFNEDGTYYASYFSGGVREAGVFELLDEEMTYFIDGGADEDYNTEEDNGTATAEQVIAFTSYTGSETVKVAFVDDTLTDMSLGGMANHRTMEHKPDYEYNADTDETAIELYCFYADNSVGNTFTLSHNKTFADATGDKLASGTWEMEDSGTYELVYDDKSEGSLNISSDGKTAELKIGDAVTELKDNFEDSASETSAVMVLSAEDAEVGLPMSVSMEIDCYADNTCRLIVKVPQAGAEITADTGTWSISDAMVPSFKFEQAGEVTGEADYATATADGVGVSVTIKADIVSEFNGAEQPFTIDSKFTGTYSMIEQ